MGHMDVIFTKIPDNEDLNDFYKKYRSSFISGDISIKTKYFQRKKDQELDEKLLEMEELLKYFIESGQYFRLIPIIKEITEKEGLDLFQPSRLKVTKDFKIILLDYKNLEINIRHLSKALYLTFLDNEKITSLDILVEHKLSLFSFYKEVSYRNNFDDLEKSIDGILDIETGLFYQHISRIRSSFCEKISPEAARIYCIERDLTTRGRKIELDRKLVIWE